MSGILFIELLLLNFFGFDGRIFKAEFALDIIGFHFVIRIFPFLYGEMLDIIFNLYFVILFSIFSGCIPVSVKIFFCWIILYSFVLPIIFSILTYCVHSSTFFFFVGFILISLFVLDILFLLLFIIK